MGGYGSGWAKSKKVIVEDCLKLRIQTIRPYLRPGYGGSVRWTRGEEVTARISYQVWGLGPEPQRVKLTYTHTTRAGEKYHLDYFVELTYDVTPWGARRYWFTCPAVGCGRRVGALYSPPGCKYFACRHCYKLTYRTAQEAHHFDGFYALMAAGMGEGYTLADIKYLLDDLPKNRRKLPPPGGKIAQGVAERLRALVYEWANPPDPHPDYLTAGDLCERAGLTSADLDRLAAARLLLPDTQDGRYRPKLAGWAHKLAYLLAAGWELGELQAWARGRWSSPDPRAWPPDRTVYRQEGNTHD